MSQTTDTIRLKPRRRHFAAEAAEKFKQELEAEKTMNGGVLTPAETPTQTPVQPMQQQAAPVQAPVVPAPVVDPPVVKYVPAQSIEVPDAYKDILNTDTYIQPREVPAANTGPTAEELRKQFEEEKKQLLAQFEEEKKGWAERNRIPEDLLELQLDRELDETIKNAQIDTLGIDPQVFKQVLKPIVTATKRQSEEAANRLREERESYAKRVDEKLQEVDNYENQRKLDSTRRKILKAHPDIEDFQKSKIYIDAMNSSVAGSSLKLGQVVGAEFKQGNADSIIKILQQIKDSAPSLEDIAGISGGSGATGSTGGAVVEEFAGYSDEELRELVFKLNTKLITRAQYNEHMEKHRAAKKLSGK